MKRSLLFLAIGLAAGSLLNIALGRPVDFILGIRPHSATYYNNPLVFWEPFDLTRNITNGPDWSDKIGELTLIPVQNRLILDADDFESICGHFQNHGLKLNLFGFTHRFFSDQVPEINEFQFVFHEKTNEKIEDFIRTHGENFYALTNRDLLLNVQFSSAYVFNLKAQGYPSFKPDLSIIPLYDYGGRLEEAFRIIAGKDSIPAC